MLFYVLFFCHSDSMAVPLKSFIRRGTTVVTDEHKSYHMLKRSGFRHETVNHSKGEFTNIHGFSNNEDEFFLKGLTFDVSTMLCKVRYFSSTNTGDGMEEKKCLQTRFGTFWLQFVVGTPHRCMIF